MCFSFAGGPGAQEPLGRSLGQQVLPPGREAGLTQQGEHVGFIGLHTGLDRFSDTNKVKFTITISADIALATEAIKAYF